MLVNRVQSWIVQAKAAKTIELFAGSGNLSVSVAPHTKNLAVVERDQDAARTVEKNFKYRSQRGTTVHCGEALEVYHQIGDKYDVVVLDPPRTGHRDLVRAIARKKPRAVIYVSCNPATLARDLKELYSGGFKMKAACGFDMFPQTAHLEAAVYLEHSTDGSSIHGPF